MAHPRNGYGMMGDDFRFCEKHLRAYPHDHTGCTFCYIEKRPKRGPKPKQVFEIAKRKPKKQQEDRQVAKLKEVLMMASDKCITCGYKYKSKSDIDYSHILPKSLYPEYITHPKNGCLECRTCHTEWEYGTPEQRMRQPSYRWKIERSKLVDPAFAELQSKGELFKSLSQAS